MSARWLSEYEREALTTPVIRRLSRSIALHKHAEALSLCDELAGERIVLHDFFADACTALFTWIGQTLGEQNLPEMFNACFEQSARRQVFDLLNLGIPRGLEASMLATNAWIAHSCSGAGEHGGAFKLVEDEEKFTFILDPCGSGGRLWRKGRYEPPLDLALTSQSYPWSYNRQAFPYYCLHCAFLNEILPYRHLGFITWPVDPPLFPMDVCKWHLYKDRHAVPEAYYQRFGLTRPQPQSGKPTTGRPWFTAEQLREIVQPTPERIRDRIIAGDRKGALRLCRTMAGEFLFLHNLYVNMLAVTLDFAAVKAGEEQLGDAFAFIFEKCIKPQIVEPIESYPRREMLRFIISKLFLADACGGAGFPAPSININEDDDSLTVRLDPCSSGGKLLRGGAYNCNSGYRLLREQLENRLLRLATALPLPRRLMEMSLPLAVTYLTETRKPVGLQVTRQAYEWSGGRTGLPYYCCLCTAFVHLSGKPWIEVHPPVREKEPCIWLIMKKT